MNEAVSNSLAQTDIYDPEVIECPFPFFRRLREEAPVLRDEATGIYQISTYELASKALMDSKSFSNVISHALHGKSSASDKVQTIMAEGYPRPAALHTADGQMHTRSRKLVDRAFTGKRVNEMERRIVEIVDELIDRFATKGSVEFVSEFALLLPLIVIAEQLGVPAADLPKFRQWSDAFAAQFSYTVGEEEEVEAARSVVEFQRYFADMLEKKRASLDDDLISIIARATVPTAGEPPILTLPEALQIMQQLLVAGNETTASTLAEAFRFFLEHPGAIERMSADPEVLSRALEEVIRLLSPVQAMWRVAATDVELGGVTIPKDSLVMIRFGAANLDERTFADGETFNPDRANARRHIAFGYGIHVCIGAALARKEINVAFQRLLGRVCGWRLAEGADLSHHSSVLLRGLKTLRLEFDPVA